MASARIDRVELRGDRATILDPDYSVDIELVPLNLAVRAQGLGSHLLVVEGLAVAASHLPVLEGRPCRIYFDPEAVVVVPDRVLEDDQVTTIPYDEVTSLQIGGRGVLNSTTGGGWIGGGFGPTGSLEGIAFASIMNALTTRKHTAIETLIEFSAGARALIVLTESEPPDSMRVHLAPVFSRIESARRAPAGSTPSNPMNDRIAQLKELAELRDAGVLTEQEFQAEKARVLAS